MQAIMMQLILLPRKRQQKQNITLKNGFLKIMKILMLPA
ncbi:hypothetical protein MCC_04085 [Rickettsia rhipicephali str. 3-7-female6-CWPP]|uniref:Uncharacterized protein n=1 Tax=Rickettsia rhipicephali (strain 3-7-female6-CWPP) TaxID=1105113 RepID=A0AAI8A9T8_RICR3|nr:hypothetical protein MCC_04085 [Rickettsia rhipicephali str. 3-7-female6-CWPP]